MAEMIKDWRDLWGQPDLPFLFAQLTSFMKPDSKPGESNWADLRAAQAAVMREVPNTYMAVTLDVGEWNDIHPLDKKTVGHRLALGAQRLAYDELELNPYSPSVKDVRADGSCLVATFDNVGDGLSARGGRLQGFAIAEAGGVYAWAQARVENDTVILCNDAIEEPVMVRYAWAHNPARANLFNSNGLPAEPFTARVSRLPDRPAPPASRPR